MPSSPRSSTTRCPRTGSARKSTAIRSITRCATTSSTSSSRARKVSPPRRRAAPTTRAPCRSCGRELSNRLQRPTRPRASPDREKAMNRAALTEKLLDIKREKGWTWKHICAEIGGMSPVMVTGGVLDQQKMTKPMAARAGKLFGLAKTEEALLNEVPMRGTGTSMPPTDPLIYRFYELVMVNGPAWKALIEEEFGDGIMSAIDFDMVIERQPDPKGDRVKIGMTGKFLPFKYYGASGNAQAYGYKEE